MSKEKYDFSGYATRTNIRCGDGRIILPGAFKDCDGETVPMVWHHQHDDVSNVLGHALLENRDDGVYCYCSFNDTDSGKVARKVVKHGDVTALSIYANKLQQRGKEVVHGMIREVSLVLAGANPGAYIDNVAFAHDGFEDIIDDEAIIAFIDKDVLELKHEDEDENSDRSVLDVFDEAMDSLSDDQRDAVYTVMATIAEDGSEEEPDEPEEVQHSLEFTEDEEDVAINVIRAVMEDSDLAHSDAEAFENFSDEKKEVVYSAVQDLQDELEHSQGGEDNMKFNVFDEETGNETYLTHDDMGAIFADAKRLGSLKEATLEHGIQNIEVLFPEVEAVNKTPMMISRRMEWVDAVISGTHKTPFSRIKSTAANLTADEARAKGYIKGEQKVEEQITALKRITTPTTVYKLQKLDRDDIIDITDFDVVAWMKDEMRMMLNEEIARAILVGDGRTASDKDKINEMNIRPIWTDAGVYVVNETLNINSMTVVQKAQAFVDQAVRARKNYKGSGSPTMFIGPDLLVELRLLRDGDGYRRYKTDKELADDLRVSKIVEVEILDGMKRTVDGVERELGAIIVNMGDYTVGATRGGEVTLFDDFDLNFNKYEYLIETRMCGALTMPYSAIVIEFIGDANAVVPTYKLANVHDNSNPASSGWYEYDPINGYTASTDTVRDINKIYYTTGATGATGSTGSTGSTGDTGSTGSAGGN